MDTLIALLRILRRRRRLFLLVAALLAAGAAAGVYVKRPVYESSAKLLINLERLGVSLSRADIQYNTTQLQAVEAITSQVEVLRSRELIERLVDRLGMETFREPPPESAVMRLIVGAIDRAGEAASGILKALRLTDRVGPRDALIERIDRALRVYPVRQAQVIVVSFQWRNMRVPPLLLEALLDLYLAKVADLNGRADGYDLFREQARRAMAELETAERELRDLQLRYGVADLASEKQLLLERINRLATLAEGAGLPAAGRAVAEPSARRLVVDAAPAEQDAPVVGAQIGQLRSQLHALRIERARLLAAYAPGHGRVRELDGQIASAEALLRGESRMLADTIAGYRARLRTLQAIEPDYNRIARNIEIASDAYQTYRKASEDRRVMKEQETRIRVQIVDPPSTPFRPLGPSRLLLLLAGLAFALCAAAAAIFLLHWVKLGRLAAEPAE